jgi:hypothetical protein
MTDYVIIPYDGGQGWLMIRGYNLCNNVGDNTSFLYKRPYSGILITELVKEEGGFYLSAKHRHWYIFNSPFEALKRIGQALGTIVTSTGPNTYKAGGSSISILNEDSRGTTWKFI